MFTFPLTGEPIQRGHHELEINLESGPTGLQLAVRQAETPMNQSSRMSIAVVSDLHLHEQGRSGLAALERFLAMIERQEEIALVFILGDLVWREQPGVLQRTLNQCGVPCHVLYGNNDADDLERFEAVWGPRDRVLRFGDCACLLTWNALPTEAPENHRGTWSEGQWAWMNREAESARAQGVRHLFVASHVPPAVPRGYHPQFFLQAQAEERLWAWCDQHGPVTLLFGHLHQYACLRRGNAEVIVVPSLNWNFAPPPPEGLPAGKQCEKVKGGAFVILDVENDTIRHRLVTLAEVCL